MSGPELSWEIITQVFGSEFSSHLKEDQGSVVNNGPKAQATDASIGSGKKRRNSSSDNSSPSRGSQNVVADGLRPNKTARVVSPVNELEVASTAASANKSTKPGKTSLDKLTDLIQRKLEAISEESSRQAETVNLDGRIGPKVVKYDVGTHVGSFIVSSDRLGVNSQCNFGSIRANTCVFKGKWQYEVQLGSRGVMQLGWGTLNTRFSHEKGVGDSLDSYAYDGNRVRKWNKSSAPYGESWQAGDIIGCCIDLDHGIMEFYRNGKSLGQAFKNVSRGPGIAYFPAASLAYGENLVSNFGSTPLQYPIEGFMPLQLQLTGDFSKTETLLQWMEKLLDLFPEKHFYPDGNGRDYKTLVVLSNKLIEALGPYFFSGYVVEQSFLPFFARLLGLPGKVSHESNLTKTNVLLDKTDLLLDIMWTLMEDSEIKSCLERVCVILLNQFRSNSLSLYYPFQHYSILCLQGLAHHRKTRRYLIRNLLFDRTKFMHFLHVRPVDESVLKDVIPNAWWPEKSPVDSPSAKLYKKSCLEIQKNVTSLQKHQVSFLKTLLINSDGTDKRPSSRSLFLRKFRFHIRDVIRPGSVLQQPVNKAMCTFFCLLQTISELYNEEVATGIDKLPDIPSSVFYDTSVNYYEIERVGGLASYLYKTYHAEVSQQLNIPDYISTMAQPARAPHVHEDTPMPSIVRVNINAQDALSTPSNRGVRSGRPLAGSSLSEPAIAISVSPIDAIRTSEGSVGILIAPPRSEPGTHNPSLVSHTPDGLNMHANTPMSIQLTERGSHTESENTVVVSNTSSSDEVNTRPIGPHFGGLFAASARFSAQNVLIPMFADFRSLMQTGEGGGFQFFPGGYIGNMENRNSVQPHNPAVALIGKESGAMDPKASLIELLDDTIIVYCCGVQRNIEKVVSLINSVDEYKEALKKAELAASSKTLSASQKAEVKKSLEIFADKLNEQGRHLAWIQSAVFTKSRQQMVYELLKTVLRTLNSCSQQGVLFSFLPEFYVTAVINLNWLLLKHMSPVVPVFELTGLKHTTMEVAQFVSTHFADSRIVIAETKDTLTQALSSFICNRTMLTALEEMPSESQRLMVKSILRPYENRAWAQSNWMLVRMWQGDGFGFQYPNSTDARRSYKTKPVQDEFGISTNLAPTPSRILQAHVAAVLLESQKFAVSYLNSVLNQLNWAFSEFVGLLQEIQTAATRVERVFIEARQLKICCTCFELTQALLRVIEMVATISPSVFTDFSKDSADSLLSRLCMLLSQIMNRIGSNTGSFAQILDLNISGLENINYYPVLSAVAGILVALIHSEIGKISENKVPVSKTLLEEPSFQINSLDFLIGRNQPQRTDGVVQFSLGNYIPDDISEAELRNFVAVVTHLDDCSKQLLIDTRSIADDDVCTICYAYSKNVTLKPCNHRACKSCIVHHLMNRGECFFCKSIIQQVYHDDGSKIHDIRSSAESKSASEDNIAVRRRVL